MSGQPSAAWHRRRQAWAYLSAVAEPPCAPLQALVAEVGPEEAARAVRECDLPAVLSTRTAARRHLDTAAADLELVAGRGGRLVTPDDDEWPAWRTIGFAAAAAAGARDAVAPIALWVRGGGHLADITERAVSVVGTRASSGYGEHVTAEICHELATCGWTIVSGAAYGIDGAAHRAALAAEGSTLAVLACGVDVPYPRGHDALLHRIVRDGLVVSEYRPGTPPARHRFLARNRLVAALGDGVVVVEAGWRSGARNTAGWARSLGRAVMAVPGPVTALSSAGCNRMLRDGEALLVTGAAEVVETAGRIGELAPVPDVVVTPTDGLPPAAAQVYEAFPARKAVSELALSEGSGLPVPAVRAALSLLEIEGLVCCSDTGWRRARHP